MVFKKKQKRLVFFLPNFILGGAGESIFKLSKFLVKYNFSILIVSLGKNFYKKDFKKINCEITEIDSSSSLKNNIVQKKFNLSLKINIRKFKLDLILIN